MNIATIIQARMNSTRFPNKVLKKINNKPLIEYLIDQVRFKNIDMPIIVATSVKILIRKLLIIVLIIIWNFIEVI